MKKLFCPLIKKACIEDKCVAWQAAPVEKEGVAQMHFACAEYFWVPFYLKEIAKRTDGTQRSVESFREATLNANRQTFEAIADSVDRARLPSK